MRYIITLMIISVFLVSNYAYADNPGQLGMKMVPGTIMENSEGLIQVYSQTSGATIDKLVATSSDPFIVQVMEINSDTSHSTYSIKIKAVKAGETKIDLAAPGFSSEEFTIDVSKNNDMASKLLIKTTPSSFDTNGPKHGYFSVETVNEAGFPTMVSSNTPITITASDMNVVSLKQTQVVIKSGSYFAVGEFDVNQPGKVQISASTPSMQTVSSSITVNNVDLQNIVKVYVFPQKINAFAATNAYAIVQLQDSSGNPVVANDDIPVTMHITNSSGDEPINTSGNTPYAQINESPVIKKGSYWAYVPVQIIGGGNNTYDVTISAKGYLVSAPAQITSVMTKAVLDDKSVRIDSLPMLGTGGKELIGVAHLEDNTGNVLVSKGNLFIHVDSSNPSTLSVSNIAFDYGSQAALVFAQVGTVANPVTLNVVTATPQTISPTITIPTRDSLTLVADPLISKVLSQTTFPLAYFMTKNGTLALFDSDFNLQVAPSDVLKTGHLSVTKGSSLQVVDSTLQSDGSQTFSLTGSIYSSTFTVEGLSSNAKSIKMDFPDTIVSNVRNTFSIELLDEQNLPVYPDHDINVKLVSNDPSIIDLPENIQIKKGTYFTTFNVQAKKSGSVELAVLADQIPLSKFDITIASFMPEVSIQSPDYSRSNLPFVASVTATYKQAPLAGLNVEWKAVGASIQSMDSTTNSDGIAKVTIVSTDPNSVHIEATISGGSYENAIVTKDVKVSAPVSPVETTSETNSNNSPGIMGGINPILFIIPVAAGIGLLVFKKKEMLEGFTEKIGLAEKLADIKGRIIDRGQK